MDSIFAKFNEWAKRSVNLRLCTIGFLTLLLLIPSAMIESLIYERDQRRQQVIREAGDAWGGEQYVSAAILNIPYWYYWKDDKDVLRKEIRSAHFLPESLNIKGTINPEVRYRSIYEVVVYRSTLAISGVFTAPNWRELNIQPADIIWEDAYVSIGISDPKGIRNRPKLEWNNQTLQFAAGLPANDTFSSGIFSRVYINPQAEHIPFSLKLSLNGNSQMQFRPLGRTTVVTLDSSSTEPSFTGSFLPDTREISADGFTASWQILDLNRPYPQQWTGRSNYNSTYFGVTLLTPVATYLKATRAAKYSILFIGLTFACLFFLEIFSAMRIHPMQYLLVGCAVCLFYILLLSLSEHISYGLAYATAAGAIVILITLYVKALFKSTQKGGITCLSLTALYVFLFTLLQLQDYALLLGSVGLLVILGLLMTLTSRLNLYSVFNKTEEVSQI